MATIRLSRIKLLSSWNRYRPQCQNYTSRLLEVFKNWKLKSANFKSVIKDRSVLVEPEGPIFFIHQTSRIVFWMWGLENQPSPGSTCCSFCSYMFLPILWPAKWSFTTDLIFPAGFLTLEAFSYSSTVVATTHFPFEKHYTLLFRPVQPIVPKFQSSSGGFSEPKLWPLSLQICHFKTENVFVDLKGPYISFIKHL